jgi:thioredoxin-dependent peroxiredoxin
MSAGFPREGGVMTKSSGTILAGGSRPEGRGAGMGPRNRLLLSVVLSSVIALPAMAALKEGDKAPDFKTQASLAGKDFTFSLKNALKKGPVVVYFYPSAYTGGCNIQAHTFAINSDKFAAAGATIIGVSLDSIKRLNDFSADPQYCAGKFPTASDADGAISKSFDLKVAEGKPGIKDTRGVEIDHGFAERTTFIVTSDGKIAATIGGMAPADNVTKALEEVQHLAAEKGVAKKAGA